MSKLVLMRSMVQEPAGLLYMQNDRAVPVSIGTNLSLEDGALNASGGGGASDLSDLGDVNIAANFPLSASDMILYFGDGEGVQWQNAPTSAVIPGAVQVWFLGLSGFGPSKTLKSNAAGDGFEWV